MVFLGLGILPDKLPGANDDVVPGLDEDYIVPLVYAETFFHRLGYGYLSSSRNFGFGDKAISHVTSMSYVIEIRTPKKSNNQIITAKKTTKKLVNLGSYNLQTNSLDNDTGCFQKRGVLPTQPVRDSKK